MAYVYIDERYNRYTAFITCSASAHAFVSGAANCLVIVTDEFNENVQLAKRYWISAGMSF